MKLQRPATDRGSLEPTARLWAPQATLDSGERIEVRADRRDLYAAVDDVAFGKVTLDLAPWPRLGRSGHLVFGDELPRLVIDGEHAQRILDARREELRQTRRPVRIGDAFRLTRASGDHPEREIADGYYIEEDITEAARTAAKIALYAAVAPRLDPQEADALPSRVAPERDASADDEEHGPRERRPGAFPTL